MSEKNIVDRLGREFGPLMSLVPGCAPGRRFFPRLPRGVFGWTSPLDGGWDEVEESFCVPRRTAVGAARFPVPACRYV